MFERGEVTYENMFNGEIPTFESNMPYILRFMIDTKVSFGYDELELHER